MSQYSTGTVTVTGSPASAVVTGSGTSWLANVLPGSVFSIAGSSVAYEVGSVDSDTQITLTSNYAGSNASGQSYAITTSFTTNLKLPYMMDGDIDPHTVHKRAMMKIDQYYGGGAGTANRVVYTNGSGYQTTGSGLTYDGSQMTIGGSTPIASSKLTVGSGSGSNYMSVYAGSSNESEIYFADSSSGSGRFVGYVSYSHATDTMNLGASGATRAALTSSALTLSVPLRIPNANATNELVFTGADFTNILSETTGGMQIGINSSSSAYLALLTNNAERVRVDSGGQSGFGVTPSAWSAGKAVEVGNVGSGMWGVSGDNYLTNNYYYNSGDKFAGTGYASYYVQLNDDGSHRWYSSTASGSAGGTPTMTKHMQLDPSRLTVSNTGDYQLRLAYDNTSTTSYDIGRSSSTGRLVFYGNQTGYTGYEFTGVDGERMRIDESGNMGLRVTPSAWGSGMKALDIGAGSALVNAGSNVSTWLAANAYYGSDWRYKNTEAAALYSMDGSHSWSVAASGSAGSAITFGERARITSGGYFKATSNGSYVGIGDARHELYQHGANDVAMFTNAHGTTPYGIYVYFPNASPDNNTQYAINFQDASAQRFVVYSDGDVLNHDGTYGTISDEYYKDMESAEPARSQWDDVKRIPFLRYRNKSDIEAYGDDAPYLLGPSAQGLIAAGMRGLTKKIRNGYRMDLAVKQSIIHQKVAAVMPEVLTRIERIEQHLGLAA